MSRISYIEIDDNGLPAPTPEIEQERRVAVYDLLEDNSFALPARGEFTPTEDRLIARLSETIMADYRAGRRVNLEVDLLARYLERLLLGDKAAEPSKGSGITESFLAANGFLKS